MTKPLLTFLFVFFSLVSFAQQEKNLYQDTLGNSISAEVFQKATKSGSAFSKQMLVENDIVTNTYKLTSKSEQKKSIDEGQSFTKRLLKTQLPDIQLKKLDGTSVNLSALKGKTVVINFWFIQCAPCVAEMPELNEVVNHYQNNSDVLFFAPALDDEDALKKFLGKHPFSYQVLSSSEQLCKKMGINSFPTNLIVDSNGSIAEIIQGGRQGVGKTLIATIDKVLSKAH